MCLITFAWRVHSRYPLLLAANRDEFHKRPTAAAGWWEDAPEIFGGRDLSAGGGWLAVSRRHRLAAVTNVRRMVPPDPASPSRGALVADFLRSELDAGNYAAKLAERANAYAGFNLLLCDGTDLIHVTNQHHEFHMQVVVPGVHGLSNASLDTPWPKLSRLNQGFSEWLGSDVDDTAPLLDLLADRKPAADAELPDTGVGLQLERMLSSPFIVSPHYGTRCSSVVKLGVAGPEEFIERRYAPNGSVSGETREPFRSAQP